MNLSVMPVGANPRDSPAVLQWRSPRFLEAIHMLPSRARNSAWTSNPDNSGTKELCPPVQCTAPLSEPINKPASGSRNSVYAETLGKEIGQARMAFPATWVIFVVEAVQTPLRSSVTTGP